MHHARRVRGLASIVTVAFVAVALAAPLAPTSAAVVRAARMEAGVQTGYRYSDTGAVLDSRTVTLVSPLATSTAYRVWVPSRGSHFRPLSGPLAGWLVKESMIAHVRGLVTTRSFAPAARVAFPAGTYLGYRFDSEWGLVSTKRSTLPRASGALATSRGLINGRPYAKIVSGIWIGYWIPIVSPSVLIAAAIAAPVPAKVAAGSPQLFTRLPAGEHKVALTFDLGGRTDPAMDILERLVVDRVSATIFATGATARTTEGRRILTFIAAHPELFEIGNHTEHHCNLRDGGGGAACPVAPPSSTFIRAELTSANAIISSLTGRSTAPYWRPPYGAQDARVRTAAAAAGYTKTFMWDVDTIDWRPVDAKPVAGPTAAQIAAKVVANARDGSIVLMHLGGYNTHDALPSMVMRLRARALAPATISDILR